MSEPSSSPISSHRRDGTFPDRPSVTGAGLRTSPGRRRSFLEEQWDRTLGLIAQVGQITEMTLGTLRAIFRRPFEARAILQQIDALGVASIGSWRLPACLSAW